MVLRSLVVQYRFTTQFQSLPRNTKNRFGIGAPSSKQCALLFSKKLSLTQQQRSFFHTSAHPSNKEDYYTTLGVSKNATQEEITKAYNFLSKKYHPDIPSNRGDPQAKSLFIAVNDAHEVLSDKKRRATYDKFGFTAFQSGVDAEELFNKFRAGFMDSDPFSEPPPVKDLYRGNNCVVPLTLTFEESIEGVVKIVQYRVKSTCSDCHGSGGMEGATFPSCKKCEASGYETQGKGLFELREACGQCRGYGYTVDLPCIKCRGSGTISVSRKMKIKIPPGVNTHFQLLFKDRGNVGDRNSGKSGDLYVSIKVQNHPYFVRHNLDIYVRVPITVSQAILGGPVKIPTLNGEMEVKIPPGTQPGEHLIIKEKGVHSQGSNPGDLHVYWDVWVPSTLTKRQMDLLTRFEGKHLPTTTKYQIFESMERFFAALRSMFKKNKKK